MVRWSDTDSGEALIKASLKDPEAFGAFYRRHVGAVHRFLTSRLLERAAAADLTAEVFASAVASRTRFDPRRGSAETWLWQIVRSKLADQLRHEMVVDRHRHALGVTIVASEDDYDLGDDATPALAALRNLPTEQRVAIEQHVIDELSHVEIASRSEEKPAAVRKRVSRGLQAIRRSLNRSDATSHIHPEASE